MVMTNDRRIWSIESRAHLTLYLHLSLTSSSSSSYQLTPHHVSQTQTMDGNSLTRAINDERKDIAYEAFNPGVREGGNGCAERDARER